MSFLSSFLLQAQTTPVQAANQGITTMLLMVGVMVVFYFFMIRPQMKRQKEEQKFRDALKKGDKVVTIGGIHGKILSIDDNTQTMMVQIDDNTKIRVEKTAVKPGGSVGESSSAT